MMPGRSGYELCAEMKAISELAEVPVIFLSALNETEDKLRGLALGAADYIGKPFDGAEVVARVRTHLRLRRLQVELEQAAPVAATITPDGRTTSTPPPRFSVPSCHGRASTSPDCAWLGLSVPVRASAATSPWQYPCRTIRLRSGCSTSAVTGFQQRWWRPAWRRA